MAPAKIDLIEVGRAMGDFRRDPFDYFLDVQTGSIVRIPASIVDALTGEARRTNDGARARDSREELAAVQTDPGARPFVKSPQSFANFYRTINRDPKFRSRWESFHLEMLRRYAYAWLQHAGIVPK